MTTPVSFRYSQLARAYHGRRVWCGLCSAAGFAVIAVDRGIVGPAAAAALGAVVLVHAASRLMMPGRSALDSIMLDAAVAVTTVALLQPPAAAVFILAPVLGMQAAMFLRPRHAAWVTASVVALLVGAQWASRRSGLSPAVDIQLAVTSAVALIPMLAWLLQQVGRGSATIENLSADLSDSTVRFDRVFHRSPTPNFRTTVDGRILDVNAAMLVYIRARDADHLRTEPMARRYRDPDGRSRFLAHLRAEGEVRGWEMEFVTMDGLSVWGRISAVLVQEQDEPEVVEGSIEDVTERRQSEQEAKRLGDLARSVLESVQVPVAVLDTGGTIVETNRAWTAFFAERSIDPQYCSEGYDYLSACARSPGLGWEASEAIAGIRHVLTGARGSFHVEYTFEGRSGAEWYRMDVTPIPGTGAVIAHWSITEERLVQAGLEDLIRSKDDFIAAVSHELRTPLTAVVGLADEVRSQRFNDRELPQIHEIIAEQAHEVAYIVEDLLTAARADIDTLIFRPTIVDVGEETAAVLEPWVRRGVNVIVGAGVSRGITAYADPSRLRQIIRNLMANAVRHGSEPIEVSVAAAGHGATISVCDRGPGLPFGVESRMFQPYARFGDHKGQPSSVGLGLYVSMRLTELMGGHLRYRRDGDLTVFEIAVPAPPARALSVA